MGPVPRLTRHRPAYTHPCTVVPLLVARGAGNWATDLAGGSKYGYSLLFIVLLSSLMAMFLQAMAVRLGVATGRDLAQACRDAFPKPVCLLLWFTAEVAMIATDLAEVSSRAGLQATGIMLTTPAR